VLNTEDYAREGSNPSGIGEARNTGIQRDHYEAISHHLQSGEIPGACVLYFGWQKRPSGSLRGKAPEMKKMTSWPWPKSNFLAPSAAELS
jgi:hypothetical protein